MSPVSVARNGCISPLAITVFLFGRAQATNLSYPGSAQTVAKKMTDFFIISATE